MVGHNPAFRIATGGLTIAVALCLVAAVTLLARTPSAESAAHRINVTPKPPIQVAAAGDVRSLLQDQERSAKPVPDPMEFGENTLSRHSETALEVDSPADARDSQNFPSEATHVEQVDLPAQEVVVSPSPAAILISGIETEISALKGQVNELSRTQLENQIAEIRHAEQLLTSHQVQRTVEELKREVEYLKAQRVEPALGLADAPVEEEPITSETIADETAPVAAEAPSVSTVESSVSSTEETLAAVPDKVAISEPQRVRYSSSESAPQRYDVDAEEASLQEFLAKLGPVAGWNLVTGPELQGVVTCRWVAIDLKQALTQVLKVHGWQVREDGDFAIIEPLAVELKSPEVDEAAAPASAAPSAESPVTLDLANEPSYGSTYDQSTGILIQPRAPAHASANMPPRLIMSASQFQQTRSTKAPVRNISNAPADRLPQQHALPIIPESPTLTPPPLVIPEVKAPEESAPAKINIEATVIEVRGVSGAAPGLFSQAVVVSGRGPCPLCGETHAPDSIPAGHAHDGWYEIADGMKCGVSQTSPELIITRLQELASATVTKTPQVQVLDHQLAEIGLTEQHGFRRQIIQGTDKKKEVALLQGGVQLSLRPSLEDNGTIRLELGVPTSTLSGSSTEPSSPLASLTVPVDSCVVLGGMYFEAGPPTSEAVSRSRKLGALLSGKSSEDDTHEIVVVIRVSPVEDAPLTSQSTSFSGPVLEPPLGLGNR